MSSEASKTSSRMRRLVLVELRSFAMALHVNNKAKSIRIFSPSENDAYENTSLYLDLMTSLNSSSSSKLIKKSKDARYLLISLFITGIYCRIILVLIPPSFNIDPAVLNSSLSNVNSSNKFSFSAKSSRSNLREFLASVSSSSSASRILLMLF